MALTGLDIFKKLPKTNCGECGVPTCLAFAMKLAAGQVELSACPYVSEDAIAELSEASAPPIRGVTVGTGDLAFKVGEETVLFRHEKTFVNPPALGLQIETGASDDEIAAQVKAANDSKFERVQQELRVGCIAVKSTADAARFAAVAGKVAADSPLPLILMSEDAEAMTAALDGTAPKKPLIHAATKDNIDAFIELAKSKECPLAVKSGDGLAALAELAEKAAAAGIKDIVLDSAPTSAGQSLKDLVFIRRAALNQKFRPLGYPVICFPNDLAAGDSMLETLYAGLQIAKYGGIIVLSEVEAWKMLPLLVLRQNIYTDPQRPMQVEQGIYEIGPVGPDSPVLVTTNFSLTYFIVSSEIESSKVGTYLMIADAEGLSVLTGWAAGKFVPDRIAPFIKKSGIEDRVKHRRLVIPGFVAQISGELKEELGDWDVAVGPREASDIPAFLKSYSTG